MGEVPWNHNIAYFPFIEKVASARPRRSALDVGTGDGMLAARLAASVPLVVGLDLHQEQVDDASGHYSDRPGLLFRVGDVLEVQLADAPFDFVVCSSTLHHFDLTAGLSRLAELTAPGGTLVIVGLARNASAIDWILSGRESGVAGMTTALRNGIRARAGTRFEAKWRICCPAQPFGADCTGAIPWSGTGPSPRYRA
jgi:SAM-dependent methyltransferase